MTDPSDASVLVERTRVLVSEAHRLSRSIDETLRELMEFTMELQRLQNAAHRHAADKRKGAGP